MALGRATYFCRDRSSSVGYTWAMPFSAQHIKTARLHLQKNDPAMKRIIKQVGPFTGKTTRNRFAALVKSIVSQQISTSAAKTILGRLHAAVIENPGPTFSVTPDDFAGLDVEHLRSAGLSRQKATYVFDLANKVNDQTVDLKNIHRLDDEEAIQCLLQVKGIGRWTAQIFLMFCLGRLDILPSDDLGIRNAVKRAYDLAEVPAAKEVDSIGQPWRPYASVASWYLWRSLD